jgi:hypothetical protein
MASDGIAQPVTIELRPVLCGGEFKHPVALEGAFQVDGRWFAPLALSKCPQLWSYVRGGCYKRVKSLRQACCVARDQLTDAYQTGLGHLVHTHSVALGRDEKTDALGLDAVPVPKKRRVHKDGAPESLPKTFSVTCVFGQSSWTFTAATGGSPSMELTVGNLQQLDEWVRINGQVGPDDVQEKCEEASAETSNINVSADDVEVISGLTDTSACEALAEMSIAEASAGKRGSSVVWRQDKNLYIVKYKTAEGVKRSKTFKPEDTTDAAKQLAFGAASAWASSLGA